MNTHQSRENQQGKQGRSSSGSSSSSGSMGSISETLSGMDIEGLKETVGEGMEKVTEVANETRGQVEEAVRKHPVTSIAVAFALGALAGAGTVQAFRMTNNTRH